MEEPKQPKKKRGYIFSREPKNTHSTAQKQECIILRLAEGKSVKSATKDCGCSEQSYYRWKKYDETFKAKIEEYFEIELEQAEELLKKSIKDNPNLLQFFLKHRHPEYKVKQSIELNHTGLDKIEVRVILPPNYQDTSPDEPIVL
jgi:transposase-like protein